MKYNPCQLCPYSNKCKMPQLCKSIKLAAMDNYTFKQLKVA